MKKRINKEIIIIAIISVLFLMMSIVYADYLYNSNQVSFNNNNTTLTSTDVQSAIDELYNKCSNIPSVGSCPEGYECTELNKVTYNANGGSFSGGASTNEVYYSLTDGDSIEKISKTSNVDDNGNRLTTGTYDGYMPSSSGMTDTVTIEGADSLEVEITYQTYSSSYSYVYVRNAAGTNVSSKLYGQTKTTTTVTVTGDTVKFYFYNSKSQSSSYSNYYGYYAVVKGLKNSEYIKKLNATKESNTYKVASNSNNIPFAGWTENVDGTGHIYKNEVEVINSLNKENKNIVLYAQYIAPICKRATTLHTEQCNYTSSDGESGGTKFYCFANYKTNEVITYGNLGSNILNVGDAFDCDVNGDGTYDAATERFYYISDYFDTSTQTFDNTYASLVYYSSVKNNVVSNINNLSHWDSNSNPTLNGPSELRNNLPTTSGTNSWRDDLLKTRTRNILYYYGSIVKSNFSYAGYAARLLTYQEVNAGCVSNFLNSISSTGGLDGKCEFLMENSTFSGIVKVGQYSGSWLETLREYYNGSYGYRIDYANRRYDAYASTDSSTGSARPVIEIPKSQVSY